jgi:hypothetical protein
MEADLDAPAAITADSAGWTVLVSTFVTGKGGANPSQTEQATNGRGGDGFEGRAPGGRGRQAFGQVIKSGRVHCRSLLSSFGNEEPLLFPASEAGKASSEAGYNG